MASFGIFFPILPQYGLAIGATATHIGLSIAAFSLGQLIAGALVGRWSDRLGRRRVLLWSLAFSVLISLLNAYCMTPWSLIFVRLLGGLAASSFGVTFAVASDVSAPDERAAAMGRVGAGLSLGFILGPALGGMMAGPTAEPADFALICFTAAGLAALAFVATLVLLPETAPTESVPGNFARDAVPRASAAHASATLTASPTRRNPAVRRLLGITLLASAAAAMLESNFTLFATVSLGAGPRTIGFVFGAMGILSTGLQLAGAGWLSRRFGDERVMHAGLLLQAAGLGLLAAASGFPLAIAGATLIAIGFALLNPSLASLTSFVGSRTAQGEVLGLQQASGSLGRIVGPSASGPVYDGFGANAPFLLGAVAMIVTLIYARRTHVAAARTDANPERSRVP